MRRVVGWLKKGEAGVPGPRPPTKPPPPRTHPPPAPRAQKAEAAFFNYRITGTDTVEVKNMTAKGKRKKAVKISKTIKVNGRTLKVTGIAANAFKGNKK